MNQDNLDLDEKVNKEKKDNKELEKIKAKENKVSKKSKKIFFVFSLILNIVLVFIFFIYIFSPWLDFFIIKRSLPRFCEYSKNDGLEAKICDFVK